MAKPTKLIAKHPPQGGGSDDDLTLSTLVEAAKSGGASDDIKDRISTTVAFDGPPAVALRLIARRLGKKPGVVMKLIVQERICGLLDDLGLDWPEGL